MKNATLLITLIFAAAPAFAADWPQWLGPDRNNISTETGLLKAWPANGPRLLWTSEEAGVGYSGPAIVGNRLYACGADAKSEFVFALDAATGKKIWTTPISPRFNNGYGDGPRCTPTVDGGSLYVLGGQGSLVCLDAATGKIRWQKNMQKDFGGQMMSGWGYSESPLIDGDKLICSPGGSQGTLAALDKKTGKILWRSKEITAPAAYSSVIVGKVGDVRQYIQMTKSGPVGVAAKDGKVLWKSDKCVNGTAIVPTPVFADNQVYVTSDYGAGCALLKLSPDGAGTKSDLVYDNRIMQNHHGGVVLIDGHIYGWSGNTNGRGRWICQDFQSGKAVWEEEKRLDAGSLTCADGRLYLYGQKDGTCVLLQPLTSGWKEDGRFKIPKETKVPRQRGHIWTHPVVANGRLYLRDEDLLFCYDVKGGTANAQ